MAKLDLHMSIVQIENGFVLTYWDDQKEVYFLPELPQAIKMLIKGLNDLLPKEANNGGNSQGSTTAQIGAEPSNEDQVGPEPKSDTKAVEQHQSKV